uniref:peptidylprolyl isomerase n=1 Tax=Fibrocapsa japonica TaxID=94617 RepID=A0A7S2UZW0_9STRA|eukprot:CAMPEP_0113935578 /NCGR_PEP_ID=MMETSP1339-20121228/2713_1 /TAXON_ID=94617 /ORGANISM="Fibrocapsa japonica" /LENGTH=189 /DNA_ID=CAMNT_0000937789 /DNA_START=69 /DNA_END=638 /DNA_ORIENTATION=- /assembly_acc=CAM_ASM_000762
MKGAHFIVLALAAILGYSNAFSISMRSTPLMKAQSKFAAVSRRDFATGLVSVVGGVALASPALAAEKVIETDGGVKFVEVKKGNGPRPRRGDYCIVDYVGYLSDGRIFDSSTGPGRKPLAFKFGGKQVIPGWEEVLPYMKAGGEVKMVVPASLAYGSKGICVEDGECLIQPDEELKYDLTLKRVAPPPP